MSEFKETESMLFQLREVLEYVSKYLELLPREETEEYARFARLALTLSPIITLIERRLLKGTK